MPSFSGLHNSKFYGLNSYNNDVSRLGADSNAAYESMFSGGKKRSGSKRSGSKRSGSKRSGSKRVSPNKNSKSRKMRGGGVIDYVYEAVHGNGMMANPIMGSGTSAGAMFTISKINGNPLSNSASQT